VAAPRFTRDELSEAIAAADCWAETLRLLGMRVAGGNHATVKRWAAEWAIAADHFTANGARARSARGRARPLEDVLVPGSGYKRSSLKERLYREGLKARACELCGQGELWRGKRMSLILDHVNGDASDNRLENLRIACPNCAATFDTHCGKNKRATPVEARCAGCGQCFEPKYRQQRFCSVRCAADDPARHAPRPERRLVERPPLEDLVEQIAASGYSAVARKYGVSDNAIRKWVGAYGAIGAPPCRPM
jgi:hypothetical protein